MGFLYHVEKCNKYDLSQFLPWTVDNKKVGYIHKDNAKYLLAFPKIFDPKPDHFSLSDNLTNPQDRSLATERMLERLRLANPTIPKLNEPYAVKENTHTPKLMEIDRGAADFFGILNTGVHLNGITDDNRNIKMWIATRSNARQTFPGKLDNMVAGGQPSDITQQENLIKECREEASIPKKIAEASKLRGFVSYTMQSGLILRRHVMFIYDLQLAPSFIPQPNDGEVEKFELLPVNEVMETVKNFPSAFKYNCNLVVIDFLIRKGLIDQNYKHYQKLVKGLHSPII